MILEIDFVRFLAKQSQQIMIFAGVSLSVGIGCLHPQNFRKHIRKNRGIRSLFADNYG